MISQKLFHPFFMVGKLDSLMLPISQKMMEDVGGVKVLNVGFIQYIGFNFFEKLKVGGLNFFTRPRGYFRT